MYSAERIDNIQVTKRCYTDSFTSGSFFRHSGSVKLLPVGFKKDPHERLQYNVYQSVVFTCCQFIADGKYPLTQCCEASVMFSDKKVY